MCMCISAVSQLLGVFLFSVFFFNSRHTNSHFELNRFVSFFFHLCTLNFSRNIMAKWAFSMLLLLFHFVCMSFFFTLLYVRLFYRSRFHFACLLIRCSHHLENVLFFQRFFPSPKCNFILSLLLALFFIYLFPLFMLLKNTHSSSLPFECTFLFFRYFCFRLIPFDDT